MRSKILTVSAAVLALGMTAACGGGSGSGDAASATGPIKVWLSNNPEEIAWGKAMVKAWNAAHPDEKVTAQEIPAGKTSEEVIGAAITAGNAPVPGLQHRARPRCRSSRSRAAWSPLDELPGGADYIEARSRRRRRPVQVAGREVLPDPVEANPVMIFYNKDLFKKAGLDPDNPPLSTYDEFLATSKKIVDSGAAAVRDLPGADERVLPVLVRLLPAVRRRDRRQAADRGRQGDLRRRRPARTSANFWAQMYTGRLRAARRSTTVTPSPTRRPRWRSSARGPSRSTRARSTGASSRCRPRTGTPAERDPHLHRRQEHRPLLRLQEPGHRVGRAEVRHQQGAGRQAARDDRPDADAHRPADDLRRLLPSAPGVQDVRRPGRRAPSRCPTCRTRWRSGRRSATPTPRR